MTREADMVRALVTMADTLVGDYDVVDLLTGLADRCVAFSRLLSYARNSNQRLTDVAEAAANGTLDPLAWTQPARPARS